MANQKAERKEIQLPFLLNLSENKPYVSSDFRSAEHCNAPYINGMMTPLWKKEYVYTNKPVYDFKNNKYEIIDSALYKNDVKLFDVIEKHFKKEDVTDVYNKYLGFDFDDDGNLAKLEWESGTNSAKLTFNDIVLESEPLFVNGVILSSRVRVIENAAIGIIVYEVGSTNYMLYMNTINNHIHTDTIVWQSTTPKSDPNASFTISTISIKSPAPIIQIANPLPNVYGISLISNFGEVLYTRNEGYYTFVDNNGTYISGPSQWFPANATSSEIIRNYEITNFSFDWANSSIGTPISCYNRDNKWYYVSDPETEIPNSDDIAFNPKILPNQTITYEGVSYQVYSVTLYTNRIIFDSIVDDLHSKTASIQVLLSDNNTETATYSNNKIHIDHSSTYWTPITINPVDALITFDSTDYPVDNFSKQYTITIETAPTVVTARYIIAPNVFLDNGNLYAWYTIPTSSESGPTYNYNNGLTASSIIAESGKLTSIDTSTGYLFDTIEAHIVDTFTKYPRENSIGVGQNFWNSSVKFSSAGVRTPYAIYVSKTAAETISSSVKYTEYSNSNCSDMLYYAGTCPRNDQSFYKYATSNSEDVAWFNPGGFRAPLKGNWNILYYVDSTGTIAIQGISYSNSSDEMGTLVSPFASNSKTAYISASNDFVVYTDDHNKIYKISLEDGAELSSIFDNKFIIVNTPSYWNMYDADGDRKYHYASDFNNRGKLGLTRQEYRSGSNASTIYTTLNRRKFVTAINPNYNVLPRYPVSSIMPAANSLAHLLQNVEALDYIHTYNSMVDESRDVQPIEFYIQAANAAVTSVDYFGSVKAYRNGTQIYRDVNLIGISYSDTKSVLGSADILSKYLNGAGNNDFIIENNAKYALVYNNQNKPTFLYSLTGGIDVDDAKWFFVIQGQYYAVIGEKLYAMIYSNGAISQSDAIVDIRGMKYIGNTPAIAFFVNPYSRQVYSFTGDANLQSIFDASKFEFEIINDELTHWYDESTQSIYVKTNKGLLVFGPQNTYLLEDYVNVSEIEFINGDIHIIDDTKADTLRFYHDVEGFDNLNMYIETSFYGLGATEITSIDRWQIVLYDPEMREQDVWLQVRSLTDVSTQAEEKKLHINANDWDRWSHSVLVSFTPRLIRGQGIRLSVKTNSSIMKIVPHIADQKTSTPTNGKFEV